MSDVREFNNAVQEQVLETIRRGQDATVEAVAAWTAAVQDVVDKLPVPPIDTTLFAGFPLPAQFVDDLHAFAEKALADQRKFVHRVLTAATPQQAETPAGEN